MKHVGISGKSFLVIFCELFKGFFSWREKISFSDFDGVVKRLEMAVLLCLFSKHGDLLKEAHFTVFFLCSAVSKFLSGATLSFICMNIKIPQPNYRHNIEGKSASASIEANKEKTNSKRVIIIKGDTGKLVTTNRKIALLRIHRLFKLAKDVVHEDEKLAQQYIAIARGVSMASRARMPREYRRQICRSCKKFVLPGVNCRVRIQQRRKPHVVITCGYCGKHMRFPIKAGDI